MENVKALVQSKFVKEFNKWQLELESYGYINYAKVLNAKDYGVPQNRERIFMISIRNDIDKKFVFPKPFKLAKSLKDVLETNVDEKYYLNDTQIKSINESSYVQNTRRIQRGDIVDTLCARYYKDPKCVQVNNCDYMPKFANKRLNETIDTSKGLCFLDCYNKTQHTEISPTITTRIDASSCSFIQEPKIIDAIYGNREPRIYQELSPTLRSQHFGDLMVQDSGLLDYSIRKLTERECFRLMGLSEDYIDKIQNSGLSKSQQYKLAGNSIVVDCLYYIFKNLLTDIGDKETQLSLF